MVLSGNALWLSVLWSSEDASCTEDSTFAYKKNKFGSNRFCQYQKTPILQLVPSSLSFFYVNPQKILFCLVFVTITLVIETPSSSSWITHKSVLVSLQVLISNPTCQKPHTGLASSLDTVYRLGSLCASSKSMLRFRNKSLQLSAALFSRNICAA